MEQRLPHILASPFLLKQHAIFNCVSFALLVCHMGILRQPLPQAPTEVALTLRGQGFVASSLENLELADKSK